VAEEVKESVPPLVQDHFDDSSSPSSTATRPITPMPAREPVHPNRCQQPRTANDQLPMSATMPSHKAQECVSRREKKQLPSHNLMNYFHPCPCDAVNNVILHNPNILGAMYILRRTMLLRAPLTPQVATALSKPHRDAIRNGAVAQQHNGAGSQGHAAR